MLVQTHRIISEQICSYVKTNGMIIDAQKFAWGNMKPDIIPPLLVMKHYMNESLDFVVERLMEIVSYPSKTIEYISNAVGVVVHLITDFFCLPHSERWEFFKSKKTIEHITYENKLHQVAKSFSGIEKVMSPSIHEITKEGIRSFILELYYIYKSKNETGYEHDIKSALNITTAVTVFALQTTI